MTYKELRAAGYPPKVAAAMAEKKKAVNSYQIKK